jgi:hypothetical protein
MKQPPTPAMYKANGNVDLESLLEQYVKLNGNDTITL